MNKPWLSTENHIVAFIDILGISQAIKDDEYDANLNSINKLLESAIEMAADTSITSALVNVKAFSDNIIFSTVLPKDIPDHDTVSRIHNILYTCACFQLAAFSEGFSVRGGITIGPFFCNDTFVWGKALLQAYEYESKLAIFPRIAIDSSVIKYITKANTITSMIHYETDTDGIAFLDYLSYLPEKNKTECIKRTLPEIDLRIKHIHEPKAIEKMNWTKNYYKKALFS